MKKRGRTNSKAKFLKEVSERISWLVVMLFGYLGYFADVRPYFLVHQGAYYAGFLDGVIVAITITAFFLYSVSILVRKKIWD
jgi:hypothetical protein